MSSNPLIRILIRVLDIQQTIIVMMSFKHSTSLLCLFHSPTCEGGNVYYTQDQCNKGGDAKKTKNTTISTWTTIGTEDTQMTSCLLTNWYLIRSIRANYVCNSMSKDPLWATVYGKPRFIIYITLETASWLLVRHWQSSWKCRRKLCGAWCDLVGIRVISVTIRAKS